MRTLKNYAAALSEKLFYNIEIKSTLVGDGIFHPTPDEFTDLVVAVIQQWKLEDRVSLHSFDQRILKCCHKKYPFIRSGILLEGAVEFASLFNDLGFIPAVFGPHKSFTDKALITFCHQNNMKVLPWTVNDPTEMEQLIMAGVDGLVSDYPEQAVSVRNLHVKQAGS